MTPKQIVQAVMTCIRAKRPFYIESPPGMAKSALVAMVAKQLGVQLLDWRGIYRDPVDLRGLPYTAEGFTKWAIPAELPRDGEGILFVDELPQAPQLTQNAFSQLLLDRKIDSYTLPDGWSVGAAGNNANDGAGANRLFTHIRSRFAHLVIPTVESKKYPKSITFANINDWVTEWAEWATRNDLHPTVIAHARAIPELLYLFNKDERTFPCLRTWHMLSDIVKASPPSEIEFSMFEGVVGGPAATSYYTFLKLYRELPDMDEILTKPKTAEVPSDPSTLWLVSSALAVRANAKTFKAICEYCDRMPPEYSVLTIKDSVIKTRALATTKEFVQWSMKHGSFVVD